MERRIELLNFLNEIYCSRDNAPSLIQCKKIVMENDYRGIKDEDENTMKQDCLIIYTTGKGKMTSYAGYAITRVDIGKVSDTFAEVAIYLDSGIASPQRISKGNKRLNIPN